MRGILLTAAGTALLAAGVIAANSRTTAKPDLTHRAAVRTTAAIFGELVGHQPLGTPEPGTGNVPVESKPQIQPGPHEQVIPSGR